MIISDRLDCIKRSRRLKTEVKKKINGKNLLTLKIGEEHACVLALAHVGLLLCKRIERELEPRCGKSCAWIAGAFV